MTQPNDNLRDTHLLWDWPTRILHWAIAGLFLAAFAIAALASGRSPVFVIHAALGLLLAGAILLRLGWGFVGSRPSRFRSFLHSPRELVDYVRSAFRGEDHPTAGHNPGSSYAIYAMLLTPLGLVATGIAKTRGIHWAGEVHGALAYGMMGVVILHLLGLAFHTYRHREAIALSMVHGRRRVAPQAAITSSRPLAAFVLLVLLAGGAVLVAQGTHTGERTITVPGLSVSLGRRRGPVAPVVQATPAP